MADGSGQDAPYGQFGRTFYDSEDRSWFFDRVQTSGAYFEPLQKPRVLVPAPHSNQSAKDAVLPSERLSTRYQRQTKRLIEAHTSLQPSAPLLPPLAHVSETVQDVSRWHSPIQGSLMSSSDIRSEAYHRQIHVVAMATGECRSDLLIFRMEMRAHTWSDSQLPKTILPTKQAEEGLWPGDPSPIQQIKFRWWIDRSKPLLAVRQLKATRIFLPVQEATLQIRPNLLSTIAINETGGVGHADVAFNPWFARQIALIDQAGQWCVLEFDTHNLKKTVRTWKGSASTDPRMESDLLYDGLARITWVTSLTLLAVCTRRSLALLDISNAEPTVIQTLDFTSKSTIEYITEMTVLPLSDRTDLLSVLTSTHLKICRVTQNSLKSPTLHSIFSIQHFQNPADLSLSLNASCETDHLALTLYSRAHHHLWCYFLHITETHHVQHCDPVPIKLPTDFFTSQNGSRISDVNFRSIEVGAISKHLPFCQLSVGSPGQTNRLYILDVLLTSGILYSCFYHLTRTGTTTSLQILPTTEKIARSKCRIRHSPVSFVMTDDGMGSTKNQIFRTEPVSRRARRPQSVHESSDRVVQFESIVERLQTEATASMELSVALSHIRTVLEEPITVDMPRHQLLFEHQDMEASFRDIKEVDTQIQEIIDFSRNNARCMEISSGQLEQSQQLMIEDVSLPSFMKSDFPFDSTDISTVYNTIITDWIRSLPESIPVRARLAKEQLARRIASGIVLARYSTRVEPVLEIHESQDLQDEKSSQPLTWDLPVRTGDLRRQTAPYDDLPSSFHSLPTPSPTVTPSVTAASSASSSVGGREISRLSQYTTFSKPELLALPRGSDNILSHWTVGEDPEKYDWLSTSIARRDEEAEDSMSGRERRRAQRRAERHILRQRKEVAASQAQRFVNSQAFELVSASQPSSTRVDKKPSVLGIPSSSQSIDPFSIGASQIMPGRFGGRPPPKKKKRKSGF